MKCRKCSAEIADKAIVCYRCGTPTEDLPAVSGPQAASRRSLVRMLVLLLLVVAAAVALYFYATSKPTQLTMEVKPEAPRYKLNGHVDATA